MEWTSELENQLQCIGNYARGYVWMYKQDIQKYSQKYFWLRNMNIGIDVVAGTLATVSVVTSVTESGPMVVIAGILAYGSSLFQGFIHKFEFETRIADLKRQVAKYSGLVNNIKRQLAIPREKRERAEDYNRWITKNYEDLVETSLEVTQDSIDKYRAICQEKSLPFPDEMGDQTEIKVHVEKTGHPDPDGEMKSSVPDTNEPDKRKRALSINKVIDPEDTSTVLKTDIKGGTLRGQQAIQEALLYTDNQMKYELSRLESHQN